MPALSQVLRSPPSRGAVRRAAAILAAAVVVAVGLIVLNGLFTPERAAEGFLAALANRDFDDARARLAAQPGTAGPLLESARLTDDGYTPPRRARVESVQVGEDGNDATVRVAFEIGGSTGVTELQLVRSGRSLLLFPRWQVQGGQYTVSVTAPNATEVEVAGVRVPANVAVPAFPGSYQAQLPDNPLLESAPVTTYGSRRRPTCRTRAERQGHGPRSGREADHRLSHQVRRQHRVGSPWMPVRYILVRARDGHQVEDPDIPGDHGGGDCGRHRAFHRLFGPG
jgi:hypothetical protein